MRGERRGGRGRRGGIRIRDLGEKQLDPSRDDVRMAKYLKL